MGDDQLNDEQIMLDGEGDDVRLVSAVPQGRLFSVPPTRDDPARVCAKAPDPMRGQLAFGNGGLTNTR